MGHGHSSPLVVASLNRDGRTAVVEALNAAHAARPPALLPADWWDSAAPGPVAGPAPAPDGPADGSQSGTVGWIVDSRAPHFESDSDNLGACRTSEQLELELEMAASHRLAPVPRWLRGLMRRPAARELEKDGWTMRGA